MWFTIGFLTGVIATGVYVIIQQFRFYKELNEKEL